jgi:hypothetical protein
VGVPLRHCRSSSYSRRAPLYRNYRIRGGVQQACNNESRGEAMATQTAAVCKRGHIVSSGVIDAARRLEQSEQGTVVSTAAIWSPDVPYRSAPRDPGNSVQGFCGTCGAPVITTCEGCGAAIPRPDVLGGVYEANPFCIGCGQPFPWATRKNRIAKIASFLDFEDGLSAADKLLAEEQIAELSQLEEADDPETLDRRVKLAQKFRELAPSAWALGLPIFQSVLSGEVLQHLH